MKIWTRALVIVLGVLTGTLGVWAGFAPRSFYRDGPIPFIDTNWVSTMPPYNEHLVRDYGFVNLGLTVVFSVAAIRLTPVLVRAGASALIAFGVPHTAFHSVHQEHLTAAGAVVQTVTTSVLTLVLPAVVFVMAGRLDHPPRHRPERSQSANVWVA